MTCNQGNHDGGGTIIFARAKNGNVVIAGLFRGPQLGDEGRFAYGPDDLTEEELAEVDRNPKGKCGFGPKPLYLGKLRDGVAKRFKR